MSRCSLCRISDCAMVSDDSAVSTSTLEDDRRPLPAPDAGAGDAQGGAAPLHLVQQRDDDAGPAGPDRMAEGDGAPIDVREIAVEPQHFLRRQIGGGEGLVDLEELDVLQREPGPL